MGGVPGPPGEQRAVRCGDCLRSAVWTACRLPGGPPAVMDESNRKIECILKKASGYGKMMKENPQRGRIPWCFFKTWRSPPSAFFWRSPAPRSSLTCWVGASPAAAPGKPSRISPRPFPAAFPGAGRENTADRQEPPCRTAAARRGPGFGGESRENGAAGQRKGGRLQRAPAIEPLVVCACRAAVKPRSCLPGRPPARLPPFLSFSIPVKPDRYCPHKKRAFKAPGSPGKGGEPCPPRPRRDESLPQTTHPNGAGRGDAPPGVLVLHWPFFACSLPTISLT